MPWPTLHRDVLRRGTVAPSLVDVAPGAGGPARGSVALALRAAPNPAAAAVRLTLRRAALSAPSADDGVRIYDVAGRQVRRLELAAAAGAGETMVVWDGADGAGRAVPSGLYFARARWGAGTAIARLVRLP
jgi:hypothetical protein